MDSFSEIISQAKQFLSKGLLDNAIVCFEKALQLEQHNADLLLQLGILYRKKGKFTDAIVYLRKANQLRPESVRIICETAITLVQNKMYREGVTLLERACQRNSESIELQFALGNAFRMQGDINCALLAFKRAVQLDPDFIAGHINCASALRLTGDLPAALTHLMIAIQLRPVSDLYIRLAEVHTDLNDYDSALNSLHKAFDLSPESADILNGIGNIHKLRNDLESAKQYYHKALVVKPDFAGAHYNLGMIMREWDKFDEAVICYRNALRFSPGLLPARSNLGECLQASGETEASEDCFREVLAKDVGNVIAIDNLLLSMNYNPVYKSDQLFKAHTDSAKVYHQNTPEFTNTIDHTRPIRIGYVSPDFCRHPSSSFLEPILRNHNHDHFEVYCYSQTVTSDNQTAVFKSLADHWRAIESLDDMSAVQLIRNDKIDILIDCAGHMMGNRLGIFAVRGAPVQVSGIGYPNTTGLKTIDYRITDAIADPLGEPLCHSEKLLRIPHGFCCFRPPANAPDVSEAPFKKNGFITFGSLHTPARLNRQVISLWARMLLIIKNSRLVIFRTTLSSSVISRLRSWFCEYEIDMSRIDFKTTIPEGGYLSVYSSIDVLLDTFPWSGHTTACEALWMGVPVLTLRGDRHAGRMVSSVLSRMGLLDLIAADEDEYVRISEFLAVNPERLVGLRSSLRFTMKNSLLCDGIGYTRSFEKCLQEIWWG